jgi:hypothetical protein
MGCMEWVADRAAGVVEDVGAARNRTDILSFYLMQWLLTLVRTQRETIADGSSLVRVQMRTCGIRLFAASVYWTTNPFDLFRLYESKILQGDPFCWRLSGGS